MVRFTGSPGPTDSEPDITSRHARALRYRSVDWQATAATARNAVMSDGTKGMEIILLADFAEADIIQSGQQCYYCGQ